MESFLVRSRDFNSFNGVGFISSGLCKKNNPPSPKLFADRLRTSNVFMLCRAPDKCSTPSSSMLLFFNWRFFNCVRLS